MDIPNSLTGQLGRIILANKAPWRIFMEEFGLRFLGEGGIDMGGLFRECVSAVGNELSCGHHLFVHSAVTGAMLPRPGLATPYHLALYFFVGVFFGICVLQSSPLPFYMPPFVWKLMCGEKVTLNGMREYVSAVEQLKFVATAKKTPEAEEALMDMRFSLRLCDGTELELKSGGKSTPVTWNSRREFFALGEEALLHSFDPQVQAMRNGLAYVVNNSKSINFARLYSFIPYTFFLSQLPIDYVDGILCWDDLEYLVCSGQKINVRTLRAAADDSTSDTCGHATHPQVEWFWSVLEGLSCEDQNSFIRFATGLERVPVDKPLALRVITTCPSDVEGHEKEEDARLPTSATCAMSVTIPAYSSQEVLREKLIYAIRNSETIDADSATVDRAFWDEQ